MQIKVICPNCVDIITSVETTDEGIKNYIEKSEALTCPRCKSSKYELCFCYPHVDAWCEDCSSKYMCSTSNDQPSELISLILRELIKNKDHLDPLAFYVWLIK